MSESFNRSRRNTVDSVQSEDTRFEVRSIKGKNVDDSRIKDIGLATAGRKLIERAKAELPTMELLATHNKSSEPLHGANILICTDITPHNAVLVLALKTFGAKVRWCCTSRPLINDDVAAAVVCEEVPTFGSSNLDEAHMIDVLKECVQGDSSFVPNLIIDTIGTMSEYIDKNCPAILKKIKGVVENNIIEFPRTYNFDEQKLTFPIIDVTSTFVQKTTRDSFNNCNYVLECIRLGRDILICGATVVIFGYGNRGSQIANILKLHGALVFIVEIDPVCAYKACLNGHKVVKFCKVASYADVIITCTDSINVLNLEKLTHVKDNCLLINMGRSSVEIDTDSIYKDPTIIIHSGTNKFIDHIYWPSGKKIILLAKGKHAGNSCRPIPTQLVAAAAVGAIELFMAPAVRYKPGMYVLPKKMDEYLALLFLCILNGAVEQLTEEQAQFNGVNIIGPFKSQYYKYLLTTAYFNSNLDIE